MAVTAENRKKGRDEWDEWAGTPALSAPRCKRPSTADTVEDYNLIYLLGRLTTMAVLLSDMPRTRGQFSFPSRTVFDCVDSSEGRMCLPFANNTA